MIRHLLRSALLVGLCAAVILTPDAAFASTALPDRVPMTSAVAGDYTFNTTTDYWSVVAVATPVDYDLTLFEGASNLNSSTYGTGVTDFVAINSNLLPLGAFKATVSHWSGTGSFTVEQQQGHTITALPVPANDGVSGPGDPDLAFAAVSSTDVASVSDVYLNAGDAFWVNTATTSGNFYFLESNPSDGTTFTRSRGQAASIAGTRQAQGCTLYTAHYTGWHGLLVVNPDPPHSTTPGSGTAYALHRYDPARPNTCPQRNFPEPTPPGP